MPAFHQPYTQMNNSVAHDTNSERYRVSSAAYQSAPPTLALDASSGPRWPVNTMQFAHQNFIQHTEHGYLTVMNQQTRREAPVPVYSVNNAVPPLLSPQAKLSNVPRPSAQLPLTFDLPPPTMLPRASSAVFTMRPGYQGFTLPLPVAQPTSSSMDLNIRPGYRDITQSPPMLGQTVQGPLPVIPIYHNSVPKPINEQAFPHQPCFPQLPLTMSPAPHSLTQKVIKRENSFPKDLVQAQPSIPDNSELESTDVNPWSHLISRQLSATRAEVSLPQASFTTPPYQINNQTNYRQVEKRLAVFHRILHRGESTQLPTSNPGQEINRYRTSTVQQDQLPELVTAQQIQVTNRRDLGFENGENPPPTSYSSLDPNAAIFVPNYAMSGPTTVLQWPNDVAQMPLSGTVDYTAYPVASQNIPENIKYGYSYTEQRGQRGLDLIDAPKRKGSELHEDYPSLSRHQHQGMQTSDYLSRSSDTTRNVLSAEINSSNELEQELLLSNQISVSSTASPIVSSSEHSLRPQAKQRTHLYTWGRNDMSDALASRSGGPACTHGQQAQAAGEPASSLEHIVASRDTAHPDRSVPVTLGTWRGNVRENRPPSYHSRLAPNGLSHYNNLNAKSNENEDVFSNYFRGDMAEYQGGATALPIVANTWPNYSNARGMEEEGPCGPLSDANSMDLLRTPDYLSRLSLQETSLVSLDNSVDYYEHPTGREFIKRGSAEQSGQHGYRGAAVAKASPYDPLAVAMAAENRGMSIFEILHGARHGADSEEAAGEAPETHQTSAHLRQLRRAKYAETAHFTEPELASRLHMVRGLDHLLRPRWPKPLDGEKVWGPQWLHGDN